MIRCGKCGQENPDTDHFCRRCGNSFSDLHNPQPERRDFERTPPRPYSWKTGEFKKPGGRARSTSQIEIGAPVQDPLQTSQLPVVSGGAAMRPAYRCPHCGTTALPIISKRVSGAGWAVFTILLIFTLFLFWIGLLIQEDVRICPSCKRKVD